MSDDALERRVLIDHLTLRVRDLARSRAFYEAALAPLGVRAREVEGEIVLGRAGAEDLGLAESREPSGPVHVAFLAGEPAHVDAFHRAAVAAGGRDDGPPGPRRHYHPGYYAAYVIDPDGNSVEAVHHGRLADRS